MGKFLSFFAIAILLTVCSASAQNGCREAKSSSASLYFNSENLRSDTFDVLKYTISLELGNSSQQQIKGNTQVHFAPKINGRNFIRLDLLKLIVDSVRENSNALSYNYNDTVLRVNFQTAKNVTDTSIITVYYHGTPQGDITGWGGFYFNNTQSAQYAFNLGVGFGAKPHNYGRVWFPCFDNFVEKSKYEFYITTDSTRRAHCNGQLVGDQLNGTKRTRHWLMNDPIPTYLAEVNAASYTQVNWTVNTLTGIKPITLVGNAADTTAMKNGFINLKNCIAGFENYFGPYRWKKFGYSLVPFNGGAMEHATNITYPRNAIGSLANEYLMAHELSHHWWGNLVTCETPEDMWINEGMASYSADLFSEWQYGKKVAGARIMSNHEAQVHYLFRNEGWRSVSGLPHNLTYGAHVYNKGEDIAHSLRGYMGDTAFFTACKYVMQQKAFSNMNSNEFMALLQNSSGQNLSDFFNDWVFGTGWSHFAIDSARFSGSGPNVSCAVYIKQKKYGPGALHSNVPLELSFFAANWSRVTRKIIMSGASQAFTISNLPFNPVYTALNYDGKINDATTHDMHVLKANGFQNFQYGKVAVTVVNKGADSSLLRIVHHFVKPDPFKSAVSERLSDQHYWHIEGIPSTGFLAKAQFNYNGYKTQSGDFGYLDTLLTPVNGDSIALFYRRNAADDWTRVANATKTIINAKSGYFTVDSLQLGEYAFAAMSDPVLAVIHAGEIQPELKVYPNPAAQKVNVEVNPAPSNKCQVQVINMQGKIVRKAPCESGRVSFDLSGLDKGTYTISVFQDKTKLIGTQKLVVD